MLQTYGPQPINGSVTLMSLPDDSSIAHDLELGIGNERHSGVTSSGLGGPVEAGSGRSIGVGDWYGASVVTSTSSTIHICMTYSC